jgi:predicted transcriptional regulator
MINSIQLLDKNYSKLNSDDTLSKAIPLFKKTDVIMIFEDKNYQGALLKNDIMKAKIPLNSKVKTYLKHLPKIKPTETVEEISRLMLESNAYQLPVFDKEKIIGVVKADTILKKIANSDIGKQPAKNYMTTKVNTVSPEDTIGKAIKFFKEEDISRLPVIENKQVHGIITMDDIVSKIFHPEKKPSGWGEYGEIIAEKKHHLEIPVKGVMNKRPIIMSPKNQVKSVINKMLKFNLRGMILGENKNLKGLLTKKDLLEPIISSTKKLPMFTQFAGELDNIKDFNKKEPKQELENTFLKYLDFLENIHLFVHLKQHDETRRGVHLIYCKMRLYSPRRMFIASDEGWGFMHAIRKTSNDIEKQIRRTKRR